MILNLIFTPDESQGDDSDGNSEPDITHIFFENSELLSLILTREFFDILPYFINGSFGSIEISVSFVSKSEIQRLNLKFRNCDEPTDVLSFPIYNPDEEFFGPVLMLGDIVICPSETFRLHQELDKLEALCLMLAHSFLHLIGWDHDTPEKQSKMFQRQQSITEKLFYALYTPQQWRKKL